MYIHRYKETGQLGQIYSCEGACICVCVAHFLHHHEHSTTFVVFYTRQTCPLVSANRRRDFFQICKFTTPTNSVHARHEHCGDCIQITFYDLFRFAMWGMYNKMFANVTLLSGCIKDITVRHLQEYTRHRIRGSPKKCVVVFTGILSSL